MQFYGDYHCHSVHSDGHSELEEIVQAAAARGLAEVAITDHGPGVLGIGVKNDGVYVDIRRQIEYLRPEMDGITVLVGAEANITSLEGDLDVADEVIDQLDILIVGLHPYTIPGSWGDGWELFAANHLRHLSQNWQERAVKANTEAVVAALYRYDVDILAHPGLFFQIDVEQAARACVATGTLFEINCGHEHPSLSDIMIAERTGVNFIINSDSHYPETVGKLKYGEDIIARLGIDPMRVANLLEEGMSSGRKTSLPGSSHYYRTLWSREITGG